MAILADAVHDAGDCLSLAVAWVLQRLSLQAKNNAFSYGYGRLSLLGALASGIAISLGSIAILFTAIPRLWNPGIPHGQGMMIIAVLGIAFNGLAAFRLLGGKTINERVLVWHFVEDVLGWVAVLVGGACVYFFGWFWVDPVLAILISIFVVFNLARNLRYSARLFLQSVPSGFVLESFREEVKKLNGVADVHDIHSWSLDGNQHILSLHVQIVALGAAEIMQLKAKIREIARAQGDFHLTIEIETQADECGDRC